MTTIFSSKNQETMMRAAHLWSSQRPIAPVFVSEQPSYRLSSDRKDSRLAFDTWNEIGVLV